MKKFKLLLIGILFSSFTMFGQQTLKGIVKEKSSGEPLPGVSVVVKGTTRGTESDFDGNFTLCMSGILVTQWNTEIHVDSNVYTSNIEMQHQRKND